jgi:hypothetical protein
MLQVRQAAMGAVWKACVAVVACRQRIQRQPRALTECLAFWRLNQCPSSSAAAATSVNLFTDHCCFLLPCSLLPAGSC